MMIEKWQEHQLMESGAECEGGTAAKLIHHARLSLTLMSSNTGQ